MQKKQFVLMDLHLDFITEKVPFQLCLLECKVHILILTDLFYPMQGLVVTPLNLSYI